MKRNNNNLHYPKAFEKEASPILKTNEMAVQQAAYI